MSKLVVVLIVVGAVIAFFLAAFFAGSVALPDLTKGTKSYTYTAESSVPEAEVTEIVGSAAPYFELPDTAGNRIRLSDFHDTPLIVVFWATWNQEAADQLKIFDDYLSNYAGNLVPVLAVASQEDATIVRSFLRRGGYGVQVALDVRGAVSELYNIKGLPTLYFVDRDGIVRDVYAGVLSEVSIVEKIERILK